MPTNTLPTDDNPHNASSRLRSARPAIVMSVVVFFALSLFASVAAVYSAEGETRVIRSTEGEVKIMSAPGHQGPPLNPGHPEGKPPEKDGDKDEKDGKKEDGKEEKKEDGKEEKKPETVKRPTEPPEPPDPKELDLRPDPDGKIRFNFRGQPWPDVLDWLSTVSGMSLDWQELPADYLNLVTQDSYSIPEARDLINRHLLARGFTMLEKDEVLSVVKVQDINPGLVPRVCPEELADRMPHEFAKVSFTLDWLVAEAAVEELKPMLSPNGKLTALSATNRLEAMDSVVNLREIYAVLEEEQSPDGQDRLVQEFVLKHARAADVQGQLLALLGIGEKSKSPPMPVSREQMEMMRDQARMMEEMQRRQKDGSGKPSSSKKEAEVHLVVNPRRNSILAHAPPDKMAIIAKAIETIDMPPDRDEAFLLNADRLQIYRLASLAPETLVNTLEESGDLDPTTRLQADTKNKAVIAYASLADHLIIRTMVDKLDGSSRQMEVIPLRRLAADYVAGTIEHMMGVADENKEQRPRYYGYYSSRYGSGRSAEEDKDKFRVDADVEGNRLILWTNEIELKEVNNLLVKLGELPAAGGNPDRVRVINAAPGEETRQYLEQLRRAWQRLAPNELLLPEIQSQDDAKTDESTDGEPTPVAKPRSDKQARRHKASDAFTRFAQLRQEDKNADDVDGQSSESEVRDEVPTPVKDADQASEETGPPPVQITIGPDGRLVISSQDTKALDLLEELMTQLAPPQKDFAIFELKHASAFWVRLNLEDYFKEEDEDKNSRRRTYYYYDNPPPEKEKRYRLSQRRPLKFIDDFDTNTILVVGADADQLKTIEELIRLWDVPPPSDSESARMSTVIQVRYSKASIVAETIKEVYRDLLSSNDKSLQQGPNAEKRPSNQTTYIFGESDSDGASRRTQVSFKGKLSLGVDDISNTLLVSTEGQNLMDNVSKMIETLDEAAKPVSDVQIITLDGGMNAERVREVLTELLDKSTTPGLGQPSGQGQHHPGGPPGPGSPRPVASRSR